MYLRKKRTDLWDSLDTAAAQVLKVRLKTVGGATTSHRNVLLGSRREGPLPPSPPFPHPLIHGGVFPCFLFVAIFVTCFPAAGLVGARVDVERRVF